MTKPDPGGPWLVRMCDVLCPLVLQADGSFLIGKDRATFTEFPDEAAALAAMRAEPVRSVGALVIGGGAGLCVQQVGAFNAAVDRLNRVKGS